MKKLLMLLIFGMFFISLAAANSVYQVDEEFNITVTCLNDGFCSNESICTANVVDPNGQAVITNQNMTNTDSFHYINYTPVTLGEYSVSGYCTDAGLYESIDFCFDVTYTGEKVSLSNAVIVGALMALAFIFLALSFFFKEDYWMLKSFFQFLSVLAGLIAVNSARIIASESNSLGLMGTSGLILLVVCVALFFLWIFVRAFKEIIKIFKEKGNLRWSYD